jgi:hypothetical protein
MPELRMQRAVLAVFMAAVLALVALVLGSGASSDYVRFPG